MRLSMRKNCFILAPVVSWCTASPRDHWLLGPIGTGRCTWYQKPPKQHTRPRSGDGTGSRCAPSPRGHGLFGPMGTGKRTRWGKDEPRHHAGSRPIPFRQYGSLHLNARDVRSRVVRVSIPMSASSPGGATRLWTASASLSNGYLQECRRPDISGGEE